MVGLEIGIGATTTSSKMRTSAMSFPGSTLISLLSSAWSAASARMAASASPPAASRKKVRVAQRGLMLRHYRDETPGVRRSGGISPRGSARAARAGAGRYAGGARRDPAPPGRGAAWAGHLGGARGGAVPAARRAAPGAHRDPGAAERRGRAGERRPSPLAAAFRPVGP